MQHLHSRTRSPRREMAALGGGEGNDTCAGRPSGRWIHQAFESAAGDLVAGDANGFTDIFIRDTLLNTTTAISLAPDGTTEADAASSNPSIPGDVARRAHQRRDQLAAGEDVLQWPPRRLLVPPHGQRQHRTVSIHDDERQAEASPTSYQSAVSADGRYAAFESSSLSEREIADAYLRDTVAGVTTKIMTNESLGITDSQSYPSISPDGRYVGFFSWASLTPEDTGGWDVFVWDRDAATDAIELVSVSSGGVKGDDGSWFVSLSDQGRWAAFDSYATNLDARDTNGFQDVFIHDRASGATWLVAGPNGAGSGPSHRPSISPDGRFVAFLSHADNFVAGDTNAVEDVYVYDRETGTLERLSLQSGGGQFDRGAGLGRGGGLSADGSRGAFGIEGDFIATVDQIWLSERSGMDRARPANRKPDD